MDIYFLRHGDAADTAPGETDAQRPLTDKGHKQARRAAKWFAKSGITFSAIVSSPLLRACQTAEPVAGKLGVEMIADQRLSGGMITVSALTELIAELGNPASLLLVGHEPDFSVIIGRLTGGNIEMKKAAIAMVTCDHVETGSGELRFIVPPALRR